MFEPGGGSFVVFFSGSLSWIVNSRDGDQKVRNAANASSSSTKCKSSHKAALVETDLEEEEVADQDQIVAYPNPVVDWVNISMLGIEEYKMISIYDLAGKSYPITSIQKRADHLEIDMTHMPSGQYLVRIMMEDTARVVQLIKD